MNSEDWSGVDLVGGASRQAGSNDVRDALRVSIVSGRRREAAEVRPTRTMARAGVAEREQWRAIEGEKGKAERRWCGMQSDDGQTRKGKRKILIQDKIKEMEK